MTQQEALEILKMGHNAFITGAAGSGKTHLLNQYINYLEDNGAGDALGVTASTGIAATHMGGMTIHAWSGLGVRDSLSDYDIEDLEERQYLWKRFERAKILIVDEVSMLHHFRLDLVEKIVRSFKRNNEFFGGLQVVFCGDFFQLPPVSRAGEPEALFAYHSDTWKNLGLKICYLEEQYRQSDQAYLQVLNAIRRNDVSEREYEYLKNRFNKKPEGNFEPTKLYSHNVDVGAENERELAKLPGKVFEYEMMEKGNPNIVAVLKKGCLAPEKLRLKIGARVMFVKNNYEEGYVNGTVGVVSDAGGWGVAVKTIRGETIKVTEPANWMIEENGRIKAQITQLPLRLAWAITVHKSQGMSLDAAEVDLSRAFERGMGYVALSRVRSLSGLTLRGLNETALKVNEEVLDFDGNFREKSEGDRGELLSMEREEVAKRQEEFLRKVAPEGKKGKKVKIKKPTTVSETKRLLEEKMPFMEIVKARGFTQDTILGHIEKIKAVDPQFDLSYLKDEFPPARLEKIRAIFRKNGIRDGYYPIGPAKEALPDDFTYEEIRKARLFI